VPETATGGLTQITIAIFNPRQQVQIAFRRVVRHPQLDMFDVIDVTATLHPESSQLATRFFNRMALSGNSSNCSLNIDSDNTGLQSW
jgi:hypothetical protein